LDVNGRLSLVWWTLVKDRKGRLSSIRANAGYLGAGHIRRAGAFLALSNLKLNLLVLAEGRVTRRLDLRMVDEQILPAAVRSDESESLALVKPLDCTCTHCYSLACQRPFNCISRRVFMGSILLRDERIYSVPAHDIGKFSDGNRKKQISSIFTGGRTGSAPCPSVEGGGRRSASTDLRQESEKMAAGSG